MPKWEGFFRLNIADDVGRGRSQFPKNAWQLEESCTRTIVSRMLRNRGYRLESTRLKKDKGLVKVYMCDPWADPMMFKIGEFQSGDEPDWGAIYDAAMERHLETKENGTRYGERDFD